MFLELLRPLFPRLERTFSFLRSDVRQAFLLGHLRQSADVLQAHLCAHGFEDMLFAWVDDGQVASLRKRDGDFQYHLRIFDDGEVRGHYEYAPDVAPIKHVLRVAREERFTDFIRFCGECIRPAFAHDVSGVRLQSDSTQQSPRYATFLSVTQAHPGAS